MFKFIAFSCALFSICLNLNCVVSKSMKKLSKSEVDVKAYVFPCSVNIEEEKFLNSSCGSKQNHLRNCKRKLVIRMTVNSGGEVCLQFNGIKRLRSPLVYLPFKTSYLSKRTQFSWYYQKIIEYSSTKIYCASFSGCNITNF